MSYNQLTVRKLNTYWINWYTSLLWLNNDLENKFFVTFIRYLYYWVKNRASDILKLLIDINMFCMNVNYKFCGWKCFITLKKPWLLLSFFLLWSVYYYLHPKVITLSSAYFYQFLWIYFSHYLISLSK